MAVAPIDKVRGVIDYAISEIPPEKIFMGVPNYGYDWALPYISGETRARSVSNVGAVALAREKRADIQFDEQSQAPFFNYTENGVVHEVWFEDAASIDAKLSLISEYGLRGIGVWNIMRFFPQFALVLNGKYRIRPQ